MGRSSWWDRKHRGPESQQASPYIVHKDIPLFKVQQSLIFCSPSPVMTSLHMKYFYDVKQYTNNATISAWTLVSCGRTLYFNHRHLTLLIVLVLTKKDPLPILGVQFQNPRRVLVERRKKFCHIRICILRF